MTASGDEQAVIKTRGSKIRERQIQAVSNRAGQHRRMAYRRPSAACGRVRLSRVARDGVEPSEAGAIPALSRNGDAPAVIPGRG
jgi:hypothetical protein